MAGERRISREIVWEEPEMRSLHLSLDKFHGLEREAGVQKWETVCIFQDPEVTGGILFSKVETAKESVIRQLTGASGQSKIKLQVV